MACVRIGLIARTCTAVLPRKFSFPRRHFSRMKEFRLPIKCFVWPGCKCFGWLGTVGQGREKVRICGPFSARSGDDRNWIHKVSCKEHSGSRGGREPKNGESCRVGGWRHDIGLQLPMWQLQAATAHRGGERGAWEGVFWCVVG